MAQKRSRYREQVVALPADARGRTPPTTPLRGRPDVDGTFRHVVAEDERLDQIAYRYYEEPTIWWRVCDANREFLSPLALLGQDSVSTVVIPVSGSQQSRPSGWNMAIRDLRDAVGVENVAADEDVFYTTIRQTVAVPPLGPLEVPVVEERVRRSLVVRFNRSTISPEALAQVVRKTGLAIEDPVFRGQVGREIVIPPMGAV